MNRTSSILTILLLTNLLLGLFPQAVVAAQDPPVVHAVLFYSPTCGHCEQVITQELPPLFEKYQEQLQIVGVDVSTSGGSALYQSAIDRFQIPEDRLGVPTLIVGENILVGSYEIPSLFPAIIEQGLSSGGIAMPDVPGLVEAMEQEPAPDPQEQESEQQSVQVSQSTMADRFALDPLANTLAVVVLAGMIISVLLVGVNYSKLPAAGIRLWPNWVILVLLLIGFISAVYLAYVEVTDTTAVCGPIGDCNTVQTSSYAKLFGILPVGFLGLLGYLGILLAWLGVLYAKPDIKRTAALILWGLAWFGTLFSIYLTFLEPFVIGATCAWCLTSAIVMTLLLWATTPIARQQLQKRDKAYRRSHPPGSTQRL